eukprot:16142904-Heterocapsa_arctica.AAC.1
MSTASGSTTKDTYWASSASFDSWMGGTAASKAAGLFERVLLATKTGPKSKGSLRNDRKGPELVDTACGQVTRAD